MVVGRRSGIEVAGSNASATTYAVFGVDGHLHGFLVVYQCIVGALEHASLASTAQFLVNLCLTADVLLALAGTRTASHTDVLDGSTEARHFVSLEVVEADEYIGIHHGTAYLGFFYILASDDRHFYIVSTFQSIADENGTTHRQRCKSILPSAV